MKRDLIKIKNSYKEVFSLALILTIISLYIIPHG